MIFDIAWEFPPNYVGGLGVYQAEMFKLLAKKYDIVATAIFQPDDDEEIEKVNGIEVYRVKPHHENDSTYKLFNRWDQDWFIEGGYYEFNVQSIELASSIKKIDLVHSHDWLTMYAGFVVSQHRKVPWVVTIHSLEKWRNQYPNQWVIDVEKMGLRADKVIAVSQEIKRELLEMGYLEDKIEVIYNGIDSEKYNTEVDGSEMRRKLGIPADKKIIFFVGRPVREKGLQTLVDAYKKIRGENDDVVLVLLASGEIPNLPAGVKHINKFVRENDRIKMIAMADVFVVPSLYEPFGIVTLEGMAMGKPTIGSRTGGIAEIIEEGNNGLLFEPGNSEELAEKITYLIDNESRRKKLSVNAVKRAKEFSWEKNAQRVSQIYKELLNR